MEFNEVTKLFKTDLEQVEKVLRENYWSDIPLAPGIGDYIMNGGGKRIRPLLLLISSRLCGLELSEAVVRHCCVIEYVHAATLLHDDVVDETTVRRGSETVNSKWGSDASILIGDYLIARAIKILSEDINPNIFKAFGRSANILIEGGLLEFTHAREIDVTEEHCLDVVFRKTASIMELSCQLGALLAETEPATEQALMDFGKNFGIAFQLIDDVMDYDGDPAQLGKPLGTDFKEGHITLPLLYLYQKADPALKNEIEQFIKNENLGQKELDYIVERMQEFKSLEYSLDLARNFISKAKEALHPVNFSSPEHRDALEAIADYIIERHKPSKPSLTSTTGF